MYFSENNDTTENSDNLTETSGDNDTDHFKIVRREKKKSKRTKSKVAIVREKAAKICR